MLGYPASKIYFLNKEEHEGKMVLFPAMLNHQVYPFYNIDEERVSMSGNIFYGYYFKLSINDIYKYI